MDETQLLAQLRCPQRTSKPRHKGVTIAIDTGLSLREAENLVDVGADYADFVKLGWGTGLVTPGVRDKIRLYQGAGIEPFLGGTLFEICLYKGQYESFKRALDHLGLGYVEVSDGTIPMRGDDKCHYIRDLAASFTVFSEVGRKDKEWEAEPSEWIERMRMEAQAGAWKVVTEARESGTAGICDAAGNIRCGLIEEISSFLDVDGIVFEAPAKDLQAWFIRRFGHEVNLGNVNTRDIISLESMRRGLRNDTALALAANDREADRMHRVA